MGEIEAQIRKQRGVNDACVITKGEGMSMFLVGFYTSISDVDQQKQLPETLWRELPQEVTLRMNRPKMREEDVFIPTLGLYRYVQRS